MQFTYFDSEKVSNAALERAVTTLASYRKKVAKVVQERTDTQPEYALAHIEQPSLHEQLDALGKKFSGITHLILIGIGGSTLGTEAVHAALGERKVRLHTLDTIAPYQLESLLKVVKSVKDVRKLVVCVVSKSGGTSETLVNASVVLEILENTFKKSIYKQTIFIGNPKTDLMKQGKKLGVTCVPMPEAVGGRYSVATEVGLVPLTLLGHDVDAFMGGVLDSGSEAFETVVAEHAARLHGHLSKGFVHYNFFAFEPRLTMLGHWYQQLQAESLGKAKDSKSQSVKVAFVPTVSTPTELHSTGQLYMSGVAPTYTDFVVFDDEAVDFKIPKTSLTKKFSKFTMQEIATGIYGGVMKAYQEKRLPYRSTIFDDGNLAYSLGLFMGMRMRETMYLAKLMGVNAFDQPNVELYKEKTREILGL